MRKIVLLGYMGSGKTTVGQKLSKIINIPVVDLDVAIETRTQLSINQIFETQGEIYFRKLEREVFIDLLQSAEDKIISLGGGTPCYSNNHELLMQDNIISIYLKASVAILYERLKDKKAKRPLLIGKEDDDLKDFIAKKMFERSFHYNQAKYKVDVDDKSIDETVAAILDILA